MKFAIIQGRISSYLCTIQLHIHNKYSSQIHNLKSCCPWILEAQDETKRVCLAQISPSMWLKRILSGCWMDKRIGREEAKNKTAVCLLWWFQRAENLRTVKRGSDMDPLWCMPRNAISQAGPSSPCPQDPNTSAISEKKKKHK